MSEGPDLHEICTLLDKLTLDALLLIQEDVQTKLNLENSMCEGETHLAKSRYILGQNSVSTIQLPTENSNEFEATSRVNTVKEAKVFGDMSRELNIVKKEDQVDPVKWFGYLVPQDLYHAQKRFRQVLVWAIQAVNVQTSLTETCNKIGQLKKLKTQIVNKS